jgi:hypothetical protein
MEDDYVAEFLAASGFTSRRYHTRRRCWKWQSYHPAGRAVHMMNMIVGAMDVPGGCIGWPMTPLV